MLDWALFFFDGIFNVLQQRNTVVSQIIQQAHVMSICDYVNCIFREIVFSSIGLVWRMALQELHLPLSQRRSLSEVRISSAAT